MSDKKNIFQSIVSKFKEIDKVKLIYTGSIKYKEVIEVKILLSITVYDDELMNIILNKEYEIGNEYQDTIFDFFYFPVSEKFINNYLTKYKCIYRRE